MSGGGTSDKLMMMQSPEQRQMWQMILPWLQRGFGEGNPYDLPDATMLQPTKDWYENLSPEVMEGIRAPYEDQGMQLMETMGFKGMGGSPRGGMSGSSGVAAGTFAEEASRNIGMQAWQMTAPGAQMQYGAELQRNMAPWQAAQAQASGTYPTPVYQQGQRSNYGGLGSMLGMGGGAALGGLLYTANPLLGAAAGGFLGGQFGGQMGSYF